MAKKDITYCKIIKLKFTCYCIIIYNMLLFFELLHEKGCSLMKQIKKCVLAYSGGLDTSIIIPWLKENYGCEVIAVAANVGQGEELDGLHEKAITTGASKLYIEDLTDEFVDDYIIPTMMAGEIGRASCRERV